MANTSIHRWAASITKHKTIKTSDIAVKQDLAWYQLKSFSIYVVLVTAIILTLLTRLKNYFKF